MIERNPFKKIRAWSDRTRGNGRRLGESRVKWDIEKTFFLVGVGRPWQKVPKAGTTVPGSRAVPKARRGRAWSSPGRRRAALPTGGGEL